MGARPISRSDEPRLRPGLAGCRRPTAHHGHLHPGIKVLLSSLLCDRSVDDLDLALDLAAEIGALYPAYRGPAWRFLADHAPPDRRRQIREQIIQELPGSWEAKLSNTERLAELVESHQDQSDPGKAIELARNWIDQSLGWGSCQEGDVVHLFQLTQVHVHPSGPDPVPPKPRIASVRDQGTRVLDSLICGHPEQAFYLTLYWLQNHKRYHAPEVVLDTWIVRASQAALKTDHNPSVIGVRIDPWRIEWARRRMNQGHHREAAEMLGLVRNYHEVGTATFLLEQCAFALGQFAVALECFHTFDPSHREAARFRNEALAWEARCREKLDLPANDSLPPSYTAHAENWDWVADPFDLPQGTITSLIADDRGLWVGLAHPNFWFPDNVVDLENRGTSHAEALGQGGVARLNLRTGRWQSFIPEDFPDHPPPVAPVRCLRRVGDRLWCALDRAIYCYEIDANRWSHWQHPQHFTSIAACADRVWFGANQFDPPGPTSGLLHVGQTGNDWQTLRQIDGLPDIAVKSLAAADGRLLVGTYGFMTLDFETKTITTVDPRTELARWNYVVQRSLVAHGRLWVARIGEKRLHSVAWPRPDLRAKTANR